MNILSEQDVKEFIQSSDEDNLKNSDYLTHIMVENADFRDFDFKGADLDYATFLYCNFDNANLKGVRARNSCFRGSSIRNANFKYSRLVEADFRGVDISGSNFSGADMRFTALESSDMKDIIVDDNTKGMQMICPNIGAFIGWKVCYNHRILMLLIPEDARRVNGTSNEVRVDKAKVLTITSVDYKENFEEAVSYVDENFVYKKGEIITADNFDPRRFVDSAGGIHIWMTREEAVNYMVRND